MSVGAASGREMQKEWLQVKQMDVVVIPKERAVFWLDGNGRWNNEFGRFEKKKIIDYFHAAIDRDDGGYFVQQERDGYLEKVYFPYEDTALFVFQVDMGDPVRLRLNTGREVALNPEALLIRNDSLYLVLDGERVKFTDRAMMKIASVLEDQADVCFIRIGGKTYPVPEINTAESVPGEG